MRKDKIFFRNFSIYWLPAIFWAGLIFYFSHQPGLNAGLGLPEEILLRKFAHVGEFGVLGWLIWRIFYYTSNVKLSISMIFSFLVALLYAALDEFHQSMVSSRSGNLIDVFLDSLGIALFLLVVAQIYSRKLSKEFAIAAFFVFVAVLSLVGFLVRQAKISELEKQAIQITRISKPAEVIEKIKNQDSNLDAGNEEQDVQDFLGEKRAKEQSENEKPAGGENISQLPAEMILDVPFTSQAPFGIWDDVHEEACEEASLVMLKYFLEEKKLSKEIAEKEIQNLKEYQLKKFGHYHDSTMEELVFIARDYYGINNLQVLYEFDKEDIKKELVKGNPIIVPTAGRELGNPNFKQPGPLYHNLVLRGFRGETVITNDPGTRKGEGFEYPLDVVFLAIHDFPGEKERIMEGRKAMIVVAD